MFLSPAPLVFFTAAEKADLVIFHCICHGNFQKYVTTVCNQGPSIKYVRTEGEGGGDPKAYVVSEVA